MGTRLNLDSEFTSPDRVDSCAKSPTTAEVEDIAAQSTQPSKKIPVKQNKSARTVPNGMKKAWSATTAFTVRCDDHWIWEISGCCLAVCCLFAIIAVLNVYQGSSLSRQRTLSINAWISIFTAVLKASVMLAIAEGLCQLKWIWYRTPRRLIDMETFDNASRGPWGSFKLLWSGRSNYLAAFGAVLTIVALAIDPFSQQIIQYYSCFPASSHDFAKLPRTNNYTRDGIPRGVGNSELTSTLGSVIMFGAMPDPPINHTDVLPFHCPSGNCTFPETEAGEMFQTLGLCHECWEVEDLIRVNNTNTSTGWDLANWNLTSEWNVSIRRAYVGQNALPDETDNNTNAMYWSRKTLAMRPDFDDLITIDGLMLNVDDACNVQTSENCPKHPWAFRCALYPCVETMSAKIVNSKLQETTLSTSPLRRTNKTAIEVTTSVDLTWSLASDKVLRNGEWSECSATSKPGKANPVAVDPESKTLYHGRSKKAQTIAPLYYPADCVWMLGYEIALGINQYLSWMFDSDYLRNAVMNTYSTRGPQQYKAIYRDGKATIETTDRYFGTLTGFITAMMRQRGEGSPDNWAKGSVLVSQTCIGVEWPWITLPVLMVVFGVAFFAATLWQSRKAGMYVGSWKSSAVAPLWAAMERGTASDSELRKKSEIEEMARCVNLRVDEELGTWRLKLEERGHGAAAESKAS